MSLQARGIHSRFQKIMHSDSMLPHRVTQKQLSCLQCHFGPASYKKVGLAFSDLMDNFEPIMKNTLILNSAFSNH